MPDADGRLPQYGPELGTDPHLLQRFDALERRLAGLIDALTSRERHVRYEFTGNSDGSGNGDLVVKAEVPTGFELVLHRLILDDGTGTFSSTTTGGSFEIQVNGVRIDGQSLGTTGLPAVWSASGAAGIVVEEGDALSIHLVAVGAHSKRIFGLAQGKLRRTPFGE